MTSIRQAAAQAGFALIEMIGVLAIIAILAGALAPIAFRDMERAEGDREAAALQDIAAGLRQYYLDPTTLGQLPATATWAADLAQTHVAQSASQILTNRRDVGRVYEVVYPDLSAVPRITISSHLLVGGDAIPANFAGANGCIGSAEESASPCDPEDDPFSTNVPDREMRVLNVNLGKERQQIIDELKARYLAPAAARFAALSPDVCRGIADNDVATPSYALDNSDGAGALPASISGDPQLLMTDPWNLPLQVSKAGNLLTVWSQGAGATLTAPDPTSGAINHPLYVNINCAAGADLDETFARISDAIVGYVLANALTLPPDNDLSALNQDLNDPWGVGIVYSRIDAALNPVATGDGFRLRSTGSGANQDFIMTPAQLSGLFAALGKEYPVPATYTVAQCAAAVANLAANCADLLHYLTNANSCNADIAINRTCKLEGM